MVVGSSIEGGPQDIISKRQYNSEMRGTFNFSYDCQRVNEVFKEVGVTGICDSDSIRRVLAHLYPAIFPPGFFDNANVELKPHTRQVNDYTRPTLVRYINSFGWGDKGGWCSHPMYGGQEFSDHDLTVVISSGEEIYVPAQSTGFGIASLNIAIFGRETQRILDANPHTLPFYYLPLCKGQNITEILMSPREPTHDSVSKAAALLEGTKTALQAAKPEFARYTELTMQKAVAEEALKHLAGIADHYCSAFPHDRRPSAEANHTLKEGEAKGRASLETLISSIDSERQTELAKIPLRFIFDNLRNRLIEYFTSQTNYPHVKSKDRRHS